MTMKIAVFWNATSCSLAEWYYCLKETCCLLMLVPNYQNTKSHIPVDNNLKECDKSCPLLKNTSKNLINR